MSFLPHSSFFCFHRDLRLGENSEYIKQKEEQKWGNMEFWKKQKEDVLRKEWKGGEILTATIFRISLLGYAHWNFGCCKFKHTIRMTWGFVTGIITPWESGKAQSHPNSEKSFYPGCISSNSIAIPKSLPRNPTPSNFSHWPPPWG